MSISSTPSPKSTRARALVLELSSRCTQRCRYCYYHALPKDLRPDQGLPIGELAQLVIDAARQGGYQGVMLSGGEPLLHPQCFDLIATLRKERLGVAMISDAEAIDDAIASELRRLGVWMLQPTLLAADATLHDSLKAAGSFERVIRGVQALRRAGVAVSLSFVCTRENAHAWLGVIELAIALDVELLAFSRMALSSANPQQAALLPSQQQLAEALRIASRARRLTGIELELAIATPHAVEPEAIRGLRSGPCALHSAQPGFCIDALGRVRGCALSDKLLGDLRQQSWADLLRVHREQACWPLSAVCQACEHLDRCGGACAVSAAHAGGLDPLCGRR